MTAPIAAARTTTRVTLKFKKCFRKPTVLRVEFSASGFASSRTFQVMSKPRVDVR